MSNSPDPDPTWVSYEGINLNELTEGSQVMMFVTRRGFLRHKRMRLELSVGSGLSWQTNMTPIYIERGPDWLEELPTRLKIRTRIKLGRGLYDVHRIYVSSQAQFKKTPRAFKYKDALTKHRRRRLGFVF